MFDHTSKHQEESLKQEMWGSVFEELPDV